LENADYWLARAELNATKEYQYSQRKAQLVTRWFRRSTREMQRKINDFYRRFADSEGITYPKAKAVLSDRDAIKVTLRDAQRLSQKYPQDKVMQSLLNKANFSRAISREQFLMLQLQALATELYGDYATSTEQSLSKIFEEVYYKTIFDYQQFIGYGSSFNRISTHQIQAAVTTAWKGKNYSERLWGDHRVSLGRYLNRIITNGVIQGSSNGEMVAELQKAMDMSAYDARRLIRTEHNQVASKAKLLSYQENGTERFRFCAVLDMRTSEICREMDGRTFPVSEGKPGVNMPPLHPFCRSKTVPDVELDADDTRIARNGKGETYKVPANMTYREWYDKHVKGHPEELLAERKYAHGSTDAQQYAKYSAVLGKDAPKTFDGYQSTKYTDNESWSSLKSAYRKENYQIRKRDRYQDSALDPGYDYKIKDEDINNVPLVRVPQYSEEQNLNLQELHQEVLRRARDNGSKEVLAVHNISSSQTFWQAGGEDKVSIRQSPEFRAFCQGAAIKDLMIVHNHPSNLTFSYRDFENLMLSGQNMISVVGNKGAVYVLKKTDDYDFAAVQRKVMEHTEKHPEYATNAAEQIKMMQELLPNLEPEGIVYVTGGSS
jgi:SPP1 gp7 family putative phage head morphogenesis protein